MRGRAAKFACDPKWLVFFVNAHTTYRTDGTPSRTRRYINGIAVEDALHARVIRRWRVMPGLVSGASATKLLAHYGLSIPAQAIIRGGTRNGSS